MPYGEDWEVAGYQPPGDSEYVSWPDELSAPDALDTLESYVVIHVQPDAGGDFDREEGYFITIWGPFDEDVWDDIDAYVSDEREVYE